MKKLVYILLIFIFPNLYSQEEFFGNQNGLSLLYLQVLNANTDQINGFEISAYMHKGWSIGLGFAYNDYETIPTFSIAYFIKSGEVSDYPLMI